MVEFFHIQVFWEKRLFLFYLKMLNMSWNLELDDEHLNCKRFRMRLF